MKFRTGRQDAEAADRRRWNYDPYQPAPVVNQTEPKPAQTEAEIRALQDAHTARQEALDAEWREYHKGVNFLRGLDIADYVEASKARQQKLVELTERQAVSNAEREALPPLPQAHSIGVSPKTNLRNLRQWERKQRLKECVGIEDYGISG